MEEFNIAELWKQNENALEESRKINLSLLKEVKMDKAKSSLKKLLFLPISTMVFYIVVASYALYFMVEHLKTWYFVFSGGVVAFFSIWLVINSIKQLKRILSVDYDAPIVTLQSNLSKLKSAVVYNLRIAAWLLPFGPVIGLFLCKALFNLDLMQLVDYKMLISFGVITIILEIISFIILRALRPKNHNKKWLNWLLQGSGSQVDEALGFLKEIETFEKGAS